MKVSSKRTQAEFANQMKVARQVMQDDYWALRTLAEMDSAGEISENTRQNMSDSIEDARSGFK